jgi:N-acylneuraminate cytidylyltransferase/CMP-N,N'-diacetyllegionaminic acid synthase
MVSTESEEIAKISKAAGASIPFLRPQKLSKDPYGVVDVCNHVLDEYERSGRTFNKLIILLPTSPFRTAEDIRAANVIFEENNANFLMSISPYEHNPLAALRQKESDKKIMIPCFPDFIGKKRHEVPETFRANGAVTILDVKAFRKAGTYYGTPLYSYIMPWQRSIDIDTEIDLKFAEFLIKEGVVDRDDG